MRKIIASILALTILGSVLAGCQNSETDKNVASVQETQKKTEKGMTTLYVATSDITKVGNNSLSYTYKLNDSGEICSVTHDSGGNIQSFSTNYYLVEGNIGKKLNEFWKSAKTARDEGKQFNQEQYDNLIAEIQQAGYNINDSYLFFQDSNGQIIHQMNKGDSILIEFDKDGNKIRLWKCDVSFANNETIHTYDNGVIVSSHSELNLFNSDDSDSRSDYTYLYDLEGTLIQVNTAKFYSLDETTYVTHYKYIYDETNRISRLETYDEKWNYVDYTQYSYDTLGNLIETRTYENGSSHTWRQFIYTEILVPSDTVNYLTTIYDSWNIKYQIVE